MTPPEPVQAREPSPDSGQGEGLYGLTSSLVSAVADALEVGDDVRLRGLIAPLHQADLADLIERFKSDERQQLIAAAGAMFTGEVLAELEQDVRDDVIERLDTGEVAAAISELDTDDAVSVIEDLDAPQQQEILQAISDVDRAAVEESLTYPENSAGRLMQREVLSLPSFWTVGQTIDFMRETKDLPEEFYEIFVVNPRHEPIGTVRLNRLLRTRRPVRLNDIMLTDLKTIPAETDQEEVTSIGPRCTRPGVGSPGCWSIWARRSSLRS
jgi:magnesium transporter